MRRLVTLTMILLGTDTMAEAGSAPSSTSEVLDIRYYKSHSSRHYLDVFAPQEVADRDVKRPVVIFLHGGTWMIGDKNFFGVYRGVGRFLAENGFVAVMVNYRLSPFVRHPEHARDVARAFAWCRRNIQRYGGDPDQIILAGHSAGGHLACLLAMDSTYLEDSALNLDDKARKAIRGVVSISGVYRIPDAREFHGMAQRTVRSMVGDPAQNRLAATMGPALMMVSPAANPFHLVFGRSADVRDNASPISHARPGLAPFLLINAELEVAGLHEMAGDFKDELKKHGVPVDHHEIDGVTHRTIIRQFHDADTEAGRLLLGFVRRQTR